MPGRFCKASPFIGSPEYATQITSDRFIPNLWEYSMAKLKVHRTAQPPAPRKGMPSPKLNEDEFKHRYNEQFLDPAFNELRGEIDRIADVAWKAYSGSRKSR